MTGFGYRMLSLIPFIPTRAELDHLFALRCAEKANRQYCLLGRRA